MLLYSNKAKPKCSNMIESQALCHSSSFSFSFSSNGDFFGLSSCSESSGCSSWVGSIVLFYSYRLFLCLIYFCHFYRYHM